MRNHQEQEDQEPMVTILDSQENPNLETTHHHHVQPPPSLKFFRRNHNQDDIHVSKKTGEDERFIFKNNAYEVIKKPNSLSCSSLAAAGEGETTPPPPPPTPQDFEKTHHQHNIDVPVPDEDGGFVIKNGFEVIVKLDSLSCTSSMAAGEGSTTQKPSLPPKDLKKTHNQHNIHDSKKTRKDEGLTIKNGYEVIKKPDSPFSSSLAAGEEAMKTPPAPQEVEESGREKLKRHRVEMAGRVWIPDIWGHEDLLKDWIDCTVFDSSLGNNNVMSARAALIQEGRSTLRIENKC